MAKYRVFLKWTVLVWLNAAFSFWVALGEFPQFIDRAGIVFGVFSFVICYAKIEIYLITLKKFQLRKALLVSVYVNLLFQLYPSVELATGMASTVFIEWVIGKVSFVSAYFITVTDGFLLSLLVALITSLMNFVFNKRQKAKPVSQLL